MQRGEYMKKAFLICLLAAVLMLFVGCTDEPKPRTWKDDFTVSHITHEEMKFKTEEERLEAILNGTAVMKHDYYVIKSNASADAISVYLIFGITAAEQMVEYKFQIVGGIGQGKTVTENIFYSEYEAEMEKSGIDYSGGYVVELNRIEYELKD